MNLPPGVSLLTVMDAATDDRGAGFCLNCGEECDNCFTEPDARNEPCNNCGAYRVFGAKEIIIMNVP